MEDKSRPSVTSRFASSLPKHMQRNLGMQSHLSAMSDLFIDRCIFTCSCSSFVSTYPIFNVRLWQLWVKILRRLLSRVVSTMFKKCEVLWQDSSSQSNDEQMWQLWSRPAWGYRGENEMFPFWDEPKPDYNKCRKALIVGLRHMAQ